MNRDTSETLTGDRRKQDDFPMRLQRYLARSGLCSRRQGETLITAGRVRVNNQVITELGAKVDREDRVEVDGQLVSLPDETLVIMLNKPRGVLSTMDDPFGRPTVATFLPENTSGLFHVGRLDEDTSGLLLFTNDGTLGHRLLHPSTHLPKSYVALVEGVPHSSELEALRIGIDLDGQRTHPASVEVLEPSRGETLFIGASLPLSSVRSFSQTSRESRTSYVQIQLTEGRKRQIRRMFDAVGHPVLALHRFGFGSLRLESLAPGCCRALSPEEISALEDELNGSRIISSKP